MTPGQAKLLSFLKVYIRENNGVCPSFKEMAAALGINSHSGIFRYLTGLEIRGHIVRQHYSRRSIVILDKGPVTADALRDMVERLVAEEGPTRAVSALISLAQEITPRIERAA